LGIHHQFTHSDVKTRAAIEGARKAVAKFLNVSPAEIFFTSGGTEADNQAIRCSIHDLGIKHAITTKIEHHAVLHTLEALEHEGIIKLSFVNLTPAGHVDLKHLDQLLSENERTFVSLMHANNEIGNLLPLEEVGAICEKIQCCFPFGYCSNNGTLHHGFAKGQCSFCYLCST
jgi:cysteine desulfurase